MMINFISLKTAQKRLAGRTREQKDAALKAVCGAIERQRVSVLTANARDVKRARTDGMKESLIDRLSLNAARIDDIIWDVEAIIDLDDPIGKTTAGWRTPNGLFIERITAPIGVVAIIYESRPNVTVDAFALAYKAGCAALLRGSSAALESNRALISAIREGLEAGGGIASAVELADSGSRDEVDEILGARGFIDVVLPRGGRELIQRVVRNARIPVIETGEGNCHIFVDASADIEKAVAIVENAKMQKPGACNAVETLLIHRDTAPKILPRLAERLAGRCEFRCDDFARETIAQTAHDGIPPGLVVKEADESDWETEFLDNILAIKTVSSLDEAVTHINRYGTRHSEAILTKDLGNVTAFFEEVDAACVYTNASTRFTDGGEFGFGAELGISTQKFHVRGPMGLDALTTIKYRITGDGHVRK
ncbi:MAG: glutamate-5-semialdehyde dehydrogenase [Treponema sp.]|jgi:glutamate-5-semialdehyde dehydrogenase|nr:glutamate-5-semialdehyde dehydrogenase [Treponema sp.]